MTASQITKQAIEELTWRGFECWRQNQVRVPGRAFTGKRGLCDILGFHKKTGVLLLTETKTKGDKLSDDQIELMNEAKKAGAHVYLATEEGGKFLLKEYEVIK